MPDTEVVVIGLDELQAKLNKLADIGQAVGPALLVSGNELRTWTKLYPPTTEANLPKPPPGRWYQRGLGTIYARKRGGFTVRKTSQLLSESWSEEHAFGKSEAWVRVGSRAVGYNRFVHDKDKQARFHARRGWRTVQGAVEQFNDKIVKRIAAAIDAALQ